MGLTDFGDFMAYPGKMHKRRTQEINFLCVGFPQGKPEIRNLKVKDQEKQNKTSNFIEAIKMVL